MTQYTVVTTHHGRSAAEIDASNRREMDKLKGTIAEIGESVSQGNELVAQRKANDKTKLPNKWWMIFYMANS